MTTATVAVQQSEKLRRFPATQQGSNVAATLIAAYRMNETQQMHTTDTSQQQHQHQSNAAGSNLSIHNNNNNNNNNGSGKNRSSNSGGLGDAKMDHHLQLFRERERERELHHREQRRGGGDRDLESSSSSSVNQQGNQQHQSQSQQQQSAIHPRSSIASPTPSEQQQYALKWNDFQSSILSSFRHLRDEEDFVDVTIACEQRSFTAHKVVLSACSPYFRKLLKANPCEHPIVILRDVRSEDIESLLRFMYNGEVHIGQDQLSDFLKTAQLLQVRGLADVTNPGPGRTTSNNSSMLNSSSLSTPAVQELKASPTSTSLPWEPPEDNRGNAPPPQKRTKSSELYRKQHGLSPDDPIPIEHMPVGQHPLTRDRDRSKDKQSSKDSLRDFEHRDRDHRDRSLELRDSLLGQALEGGPTLSVPSSVGANNHISITPGKLTNNSSQDNLEMRFPNVFSQQKHPDLLSLQNVANGDDSNSSDTGASDHGDDIESMNENVEHTRPSFPFLGLQGIPGLIPGPSGMHGDNFEIRVRATDPRPCPKCGKIYRSAHTLRTHLEDKHTVCPGYRCVLCGTVAKSRNSLHSHMSRQHRGISTKDLPVLPMPSPFDPELASRLLAKAGVKISPAELRARASPTGTRRNDGMKLELRSGGEGDDFDDPEDLTMSQQSGHSEAQRRFHESMLGMSPSIPYGDLSAFNHPSTTITRVRQPDGGKGDDGRVGGNGSGLSGMGGADRLGGGGGSSGNPMQQNTPTGSAILDTYLQFITENAFGMGGMTPEQATAAIQAAKYAQLKAMGHNLEQLPPGFLPPQLDIAKLAASAGADLSSLGKLQSSPNVTIEPSGNRDDRHQQHLSAQQKLLSLAAGNGNHNLNNNSILHNDSIRRGDSSEPMDLGLDGPQHHHGGNDDGNSSGDERNFSDDEGVGTN
ncbi:protein abrupt isoform X2 [Uranotaenia lowii]|uniref:protein abrupt isoform X2 n=1 Tax=Uranotaenia lowii TaxID=190385 RepID=UPI002479F9A2|nr:protein abrupt isoform X2 [Uranotaenia lowii]